MTTKHDNPTLAEALRHYGMGELAEAVETVTVAAVIEGLTQTTVRCDVINPGSSGEPFRRCEFLRSEVTVTFYNVNSAIVRIPKAYLPVFCLWKFELTGRLLDHYSRLAERHNAPYLKTTPAGKPEMIGRVRI